MLDADVTLAKAIADQAKETYMSLCQAYLDGEASEADEREIEMFLLGHALATKGYDGQT